MFTFFVNQSWRLHKLTFNQKSGLLGCFVTHRTSMGWSYHEWQHLKVWRFKTSNGCHFVEGLHIRTFIAYYFFPFYDDPNDVSYSYVIFNSSWGSPRQPREIGVRILNPCGKLAPKTRWWTPHTKQSLTKQKRYRGLSSCLAVSLPV